MRTPCHAAPSGWKRGGATFRNFLFVFSLIGLIGLIGISQFKKAIRDQLQVRVQKWLDEKLAATGFRVTIGSVDWNEGHGLLVRDVSVRLDGPGSGTETTPIMTIPRAWLKSTFQLTDIISRRPRIEELIANDLVLNLHREASGKWNVSEAIDRLVRIRCPDQEFPLDFPVHLRNATISIQEGRPESRESAFELTRINLDFQWPSENRESDETANEFMVASLESEMTGAVQCRLWLEPDSATWAARLQVASLRLGGLLNGQLARWLPSWSELIGQIDGRVSLTARMSGLLAEPPSEVHITGRAEGLQCLDNRLPHLLHQGSLDFEVANRKLEIRNAVGRFGYGQVNGALVLPDWTRPDEWECRAEVADFELNERLVMWLPETLQRTWHEFQPTGIISGSFVFSRLDGEGRRTIRSSISNGSFSWYRFPFRVSNCSGEIHVDDRVLTISGTAIEAQQLVRLEARIVDPGPFWTGWMTGQCDGNLPVNEKALQAFDAWPDVARTLRRFEGIGHVAGRGRIERRDPRAERVNCHYEVQLRQATLRYDAFRYPFHNVNGLIIVDDEVTRFEEFTASNNYGEVQCAGTWRKGGELKLKFLAQSIALDEDLRTALAPGLQRFWRELRPAGTIDRVNVELAWNPLANDLDIDLDGEIYPASGEASGSATIKPVWFPYELRQVSGRFRFHDERIDIYNLTGRHGRTALTCAGTGAWDDQRWNLRLTDLLASNVVLDRELMAALPTALGESIEAVEFDGKLSLQGTIDVRGNIFEAGNSANAPGSERLEWNLDVAVGQGSLNPGLPIRNVNGVVSTRGVFENDRLRSHGTLAIDSMMYNDVQITDFRGPIYVDNDRLAIGSLGESETPGTPSVTTTANVFGGDLRCDGQLIFDNDREFYIQAILGNASLREIAMDFSGNRHDLAGTAFAGIRMTGDASGSHSIKGDGFIQLKEARIYKLPVVLALLNGLRVEDPDAAAFDQGELEFSIRGEDIEFRKIEMNGNAFSLIGNGRMNLDREIDLEFYSVMGRNRFEIPVISPLFRAGSQQILWIEVNGTLDDPQTVNNVLPGLNDSLRKLFPELDPQGTTAESR